MSHHKYCAILYLVTVLTGINGQESFIVGGTNASPGQIPYQVSMRTSNNVHYCGGSIISSRWILTAAHCVKPTYATSVVVGSVQLSSGGQRYTIEKNIPHQDYNTNTLVNDIALVKTEVPIQFNNYVQPILTATYRIGDGVSVLISGWGQTTHPGTAPDYLQMVNVRTMNQDECINAVAGTRTVVDSTLCAFKSGTGVCFGDSGGPVVGNGVLHGVISWTGLACAQGRPDGNTRVSSFKTWIWWTQLKN